MSQDKIGIIDIGSNTVRLVIYQPPYSPSDAILNEKIMCALGADLLSSGRLSPAGKRKTIKTLKGFVETAKAYHVVEMRAIATAAMRDASDGPDFAQEIEQKTGLPVEIISGEQEAIYSALGVLAAYPDADGVMGDLGGGSLELAQLSKGKAHHPISLPLGVLRIQSQDYILHNAYPVTEKNLIKDDGQRVKSGQGNNEKYKNSLSSLGASMPSLLNLRYVKFNLEKVPSELAGHKRFYAVGGTWRALGVAYAIEMGQDPDYILHNALCVEEIVRFIEKLRGVSARTLTRKYQVEAKRTKLLPIAAALLPLLLDKLGSQEIIFSPTSLREGVLVEMIH